MLNASDEDYKTAVAANLIQHRSDISDISATLNDQKDVNGNSGVLETQDWQTGKIETHTTQINKVLSNTFNPAGCTDNTHHWVFVVGTDNSVYMIKYGYNGSAWSAWTQVGGAFSSGVSAYYQGGTTPTVHVYGISTVGADLFHFWMPVSTGVWHNENLHGNSGSLGQ